MGNGDSVTCDGPGTPYSASDPNATTDCSYTWPQAGSYTVTATVYWSVTWTAVGRGGRREPRAPGRTGGGGPGDGDRVAGDQHPDGWEQLRKARR